MDKLLNPLTGDYQFTNGLDNTLANAVYLRLMTPLGAWWADKTLGSRLHELEREKDVSRVRLLAKQYAEQALQPLLDDNRASMIDVTTEPEQAESTGRLLLLIRVADATGKEQIFKHHVKVI